MEVAVADMADDGRDQVVLADVVLGLDDAFGEPADRHADVGRPHFRALADILGGIGGVVARLPQLRPLLGARRPLEIPAAPFVGNRLDHLGLLGRAGLGAVELEPQHRRDRQVGARIVVGRLHLHLVGDLDARDRDAELDGLDHRVDRRFERRVGAQGRDDGFGNAVETQGDLGNHAQRALGADEQAGEVVAGRGLARPLRRPDDPAVGGDHGEAEHVLAHGAVAHRVGPARPGRCHAADRGVGARIDREKQAGIAQIFVELLARHAGLDAAVQVLGVDLQHRVHARQVDAQAAVERRDMAFERCAGAEGDDRHPVFGADLDRLSDLLGRFGVEHGVRRHDRVMVLALAVLLAHRFGGRQPVAETLPEHADRLVDPRLRPVLDRAVYLQRHAAASPFRAGCGEPVSALLLITPPPPKRQAARPHFPTRRPCRKKRAADNRARNSARIPPCRPFPTSPNARPTSLR